MNSPTTPIAARFTQLREAGQMAFMPFVTAGDPDLDMTLVVIGELGNGGAKAGKNMLTVRAAQRAAAARSEIAKHTAFVPTTAFARPARQSPNVGHGHHWFGNAESYFLIGDAMGHAMLKLISQDTSSTSTKPPGKTPR